MKVLEYITFVLFLALLALFLTQVEWPTEIPLENQVVSTPLIGELLFTNYVVPFEILSIVLLAAMIGAIFLAKREPSK